MKTNIAAICGALALAAQPVSATNFAVLLGGGIEGESLDPAFPGGIDVVSVSVEGNLDEGSIGRVVIHKRVDKATPKLMEACVRNQFIRNVVLFGRTQGDDPRNFLRVEFIDVLVTGVSQEKPATPDAEPLESVELRCSSIHFTYQDPRGMPTGAHLSPLVGGPDADGDGIPDAVEEHYGLNPEVNDADGDLDGDGMSNIDELRLGFNPASGGSFFKAEVSPVPGNGNEVDVAWESVPGQTYAIEWSPDLKAPFNPFTHHTPEGTRATVRLTKTGFHGFYRVRPVNN